MNVGYVRFRSCASSSASSSRPSRMSRRSRSSSIQAPSLRLPLVRSCCAMNTTSAVPRLVVCLHTWLGGTFRRLGQHGGIAPRCPSRVTRMRLTSQTNRRPRFSRSRIQSTAWSRPTGYLQVRFDNGGSISTGTVDEECGFLFNPVRSRRGPQRRSGDRGQEGAVDPIPRHGAARL
jgi:hypothetical protein